MTGSAPVLARLGAIEALLRKLVDLHPSVDSAGPAAAVEPTASVPRMLSTAEIAALGRLHKVTVRRAARAGRIRCEHRGPGLRLAVPREDALAYLESLGRCPPELKAYARRTG